MCGRFALTYAKPKIEQYLNIQIPFDLPPRYNIAPTQNTLVICTQDRLPQMMHWGFLPFWAKDKKIKEQINAKSETIHEKPMFRQAFKSHRCLVVASGFFEWQQEDVGGKSLKQPFYIHKRDDEPMIFAAIWDRCEREGIQTGFSILTTQANSTVSKFHSRMPVMLNLENIDLWLSLNASWQEVSPLFEPDLCKNLKVNKISKAINSPKNDYPDLLN